MNERVKLIRKQLGMTQEQLAQRLGIGKAALSMIETALELTEQRVSGAVIQQILDLAKEQLLAPTRLLEHVAEVVDEVRLADAGDVAEHRNAGHGRALTMTAKVVVSDLNSGSGLPFLRQASRAFGMPHPKRCTKPIT